MDPILQPDSEGVFSSPLGTVDLKELQWKTMKDFLTHVFLEKHPEKQIVEPQTERKITFQKLFETAEKLAEKLLEKGIGPKTVVHIVGENRMKWLLVMTAAHINRYIVSSSHPVSPWPEIQRNIQTTCSTVLILSDSCHQKFAKEINSPYLTTVIAVDDHNDADLYDFSYKMFSNNQTRQPELNPEELNDICELLLSSGTTGVPKAVKFRDIDVIVSCILTTEKGALTIGENANLPIVQPLAHIGGQNVCFLAAAWGGANLFVLDYPGSIGLVEVVQKYRITHLLAVPPVLNFLAKYEDLEQFDLSSLKYILTGGTTINFDSISTIIKRSGNSGVKMKNLYGATETLGLIFTTNDFYETVHESIGIPLRGVKYKLCSLDDENKVITKPNQEGELVIKCDQGLSLYFNDPKKTEESLTKDGYYKSGDVVYLDENNNVFVTSRIKDVVKFRGFSVSPAEIEDIVLSSPLTADCAVVGESCEEHGEIPVAFVVPSSEGKSIPEEDLKSKLIKFVEENIANHKKIHKVYPIDKIPRSGSGKVLKRELKKLID